MLANTTMIDNILSQVNQLSPDDKLRLIHRITATLLPPPEEESRPLQYGKYSNNRMSTLEDFALAEWHPTDCEFDDN